jgi:TRAP-type C4-dicarboxylate transport system substrate-binding protein
MSRARGTLTLGLALAVALGGVAAAEPVTLRMASVTPEGTAWARELRAFGREVAASTRDQVLTKWYLSGIAGDELRQQERMERDQLDGVVSGGMLCQRLAPSLRAVSVAGLFRDRDEVMYVLNRLKPTIDAEAAQAGYVNVAEAGMGFSVLFSRTPVRTLVDLRKFKPWLWSLDYVLGTQLAAAGIKALMLPVQDAARAYDDGKVDGFIAVPSAALAFQWSAEAKYVTELHVGYLTGCMLVSKRAWEALSHEDQQIVRAAAAKLAARIEDAARQIDETLLKGLFARQGLVILPASQTLQTEFNEAARASQKDVENLTPPGVIARIAGWLGEYRSHRADRR